MENRNIKLVRLLSGEEILGEIVQQPSLLSGSGYAEEDTNGGVTILEPLLVIAQPAPDGKNVRLGFAPWIMFKKEGEAVTLRASSIVAVMNADPKLVENYTRATSKLELPQQNIVVPIK
jgi:hypothetical protein